MRSYVANYSRLVNGVYSRRVLSMTPRALGPAGTAHEGDMPGPKEFFQAAAFLSENERPTVQPLSEQDLTPELIAEKAAKFNVLPEDYYPMSMKTPHSSFGDYPVTVGETYNNKSANYEWDDFRQRKNYGEPLGINQIRDYGPFSFVNDAHYHPYGFYQYYEYWRTYLWQHVFSGIVVCCVMLRINELSDYLVNGKDSEGSESYAYIGKFWYNKHWSHTELEFREVFNKMQQAKMGYPGYSETHELHRCQDTTAYFMGAVGTTAGRDRHGPTGTSPLRREAQETYMPPAGPMAFKHLAYQTFEPLAHDQDPAWSFAKSVHPHAGHCTNSSHYKLQTEVVEQVEEEADEE